MRIHKPLSGNEGHADKKSVTRMLHAGSGDSVEQDYTGSVALGGEMGQRWVRIIGNVGLNGPRSGVILILSLTLFMICVSRDFDRACHF